MSAFAPFNGLFLVIVLALFGATSCATRAGRVRDRHVWRCHVEGCANGEVWAASPDEARADAARHYMTAHHRTLSQCDPCAHGNHYRECARYSDGFDPCRCACLSASQYRAPMGGAL